MRIILTAAALAGFCCGALSAADATAGKEVFDKSCKPCHGADGTPNAGVAKMMKVDIKDLKSAAVQGLTDGGLQNDHHCW